MSTNLSEFMLAAFACSASLCIRLRSILRNRFVTSLLNLSTHVLQSRRTLYVFSAMIKEQVFFGNSAFCPGGQRFLSEGHLKEFANAYCTSENVLKHEISLANNFLRKELQLPTWLKQFLSFIAHCKAAFDCSYTLLRTTVTFSATSAAANDVFQK